MCLDDFQCCQSGGTYLGRYRASGPSVSKSPTVGEALAAAAGLSAIQLVQNAIAKKLQQTIHHFASIPPLVIVSRHHLSCQLLALLN